MILAQNKEEVVSNIQVEETAQVTIESTPEAIKFLIGMLCNLYPKPKDTMMVEYVQNAIDSHDVAQCADRPIDITLPNMLEPFFIVRDYGVGMTHQMVMGMYTKAMGSTKRDSNDQRGGYGVGKLVFAAYSGVMMLNTWDGTHKRIYTFRLKDGDGEISLNTTIPSTEERGVEVKIPINEEDIQYFNNRAQYLYSFLPTKPTITNNDSIDLNPNASFQNEKFTLLEDFMDETSQALVTIGGLVFPIEPSEIYKKSNIWGSSPADKTEETILKVLSNIPIVLHFDVGEIEHTPSRSSLMYSEKTINAIRDRVLVDVRQLAEERFKELVENVDSPWNARLTDYQINNKASFSSKLFRYYNLNQRGVEYNGVEYSSTLPKHYGVDTLSHYELEYGSTLDDPKWAKVFHTDHYQNYHSSRNQRINYKDKLDTETMGDIVLNEGVEYYCAEYDYSSRKISIKIKHYLETDAPSNNVKTLILREGESIEEFAERLQVPASLFKSIDDLPNPPKMYKSRKSGSYDRTSHDSKVLKWIGGGVQAAENWEEASLDLKNDKVVYVSIKYYKPWNEADGVYADYSIDSVISALKSALGEDIEVYGVRTTETNKIGANMIHLDDLIKTTVANLKEDIGNAHLIIKSTRWTEMFSHNYNRIVNHSTAVDCEAIKYIAERFTKASEVYKSIRPIQEKIRLHNSLVNFMPLGEQITIGTNREAHEKLNGMVTSLARRYPMLRATDVNSSINENAVEYINAINFYRKNNKTKSLTA